MLRRERLIVGLISLDCPNCGGHVQIDEDIDVCFCMYCGQQLLLKNRQVIIVRDEAKLRELELQEEERKRQEEQAKAKLAAEIAKQKLEEEKHRQQVREWLRLLIVTPLCGIILPIIIVWLFKLFGGQNVLFVILIIVLFLIVFVVLPILIITKLPKRWTEKWTDSQLTVVRIVGSILVIVIFYNLFIWLLQSV